MRVSPALTRFWSLMFLFAGLVWSGFATAMPAFARQYQMSCNACHSAFPGSMPSARTSGTK